MKEVFIGNKIYIFEELTSTMDLSKEMILKDIEEGTTIIANNQSKGRVAMIENGFRMEKMLFFL